MTAARLAYESAVGDLAAAAGVGRDAGTIACISDSTGGPNGYPAWPVSGAAIAAISAAAPGALSWATAFLGGRAVVINNQAVGGVGVAHALATQLPAILALNPLPAWVYVHIGTNDLGSSVGQGASTIAGLTTLYAAIRDAGCGLIACTVTRKDGNLGAAYNLNLAQVNDFITRYAREHKGVVLVDYAAVTGKPDTGGWKTGYAADGIHQDALGAQAQGREIARVLAPFIPEADGLVNTNTDPLNLIVNGMLLGSTSGVATSWTNGFGGGATLTKVARTDQHPGDWQQIALSSGNGSLSQSFTPTAGDVLVAQCEVDCDDDWTAVTKLGLRLTPTGGAGGVADHLITGAGPIVSPNGRLVLRTHPIKVAASTTAMTFALDLAGTAGTVRVARCSVKKV